MRRLARLTSRQVLYAAIAGDLLVAVTKLVAAGFTNSSAMLSEAVHSIVDTSNSFLVLYGLHRSKSPPDHDHPLGFGREIYFWSFVVAVMIFALGAGVTFYEGVNQILRPREIRNVEVTYVVLALSALFDGTTWWLALSSFRKKLKLRDVAGAIHDSKDPPSFIVIFEDSAALAGLLVAFLGILLSSSFDAPVIDGVASLLISAVLATTSALLVRETKGLLMGEPAEPAIVESLMRIARETEGIANANGILTVHLAPTQIVVALSLEFADALTTSDIEAKVVELERRVRHLHPSVVAVFVKPQSKAGYADAMLHRRHRATAADAHTPPLEGTI